MDGWQACPSLRGHITLSPSQLRALQASNSHHLDRLVWNAVLISQEQTTDLSVARRQHSMLQMPPVV